MSYFLAGCKQLDMDTLLWLSFMSFRPFIGGSGLKNNFRICWSRNWTVFYCVEPDMQRIMCVRVREKATFNKAMVASSMDAIHRGNQSWCRKWSGKILCDTSFFNGPMLMTVLRIEFHFTRYRFHRRFVYTSMLK